MKDYISDLPKASLVSQDGLSRLELCATGYEFPDEKTGWDADWLMFHLNFLIPGFTGKINDASIMGHELASFLKELISFSEMKKTQVFFVPIEPYLNLDFAFDSKKQVIINGSLQYPVGSGATLSFEFETDLTFLDKFILGLTNILKEFPSRFNENNK